MNKFSNKAAVKREYAGTHKIALDMPSVLSSVEVLIASRLRERHRRSVAEPETETKTQSDSGRLVEAVDDFVDVKLRLAPAGTLKEGGYERRANVREYYKVDVPKEGTAGVALNISSFCADSLRRDDSYLERYPEKTLSDLMASGKMAVTGGGDVSGQVTFQGLPRLSSFLVCENQNASDALMAGGKQSGGEHSSSFAFDYESGVAIPLENDTLGERYSTRVEFDDGHGTFYGGGDGRGLVPGEYGTLKFQGNRFISYIPKADTDVIGKVDVFTYKVIDRSGAEDTANIIVRIGSDQADLEWDPDDPYAQALRAKVWDYADSATVEILQETTYSIEENALSYSWEYEGGSAISGKARGSKMFTIDEHCRSNLTIDIKSDDLPKLLDCIEVELAKVVDHAHRFIVAPDYGHSAKHMNVGDGRIQITAMDLEPGTYRLDVSNRPAVATAGSLRVDLAFENTRSWVGGTKHVSGNVLGNDADREAFAQLSIGIDGKGYEVPDAEGSQVRGKFGVLTIAASGDYVYAPDGDQNNIGEFDSFRYQLRRSDGAVIDERLTIGIKGERRQFDPEIDGVATEAVSLDGLDADRNTREEENRASERDAEGRSSSSDSVSDAEATLLVRDSSEPLDASAEQHAVASPELMMHSFTDATRLHEDLSAIPSVV